MTLLILLQESFESPKHHLVEYGWIMIPLQAMKYIPLSTIFSTQHFRIALYSCSAILDSTGEQKQNPCDMNRCSTSISLL